MNIQLKTEVKGNYKAIMRQFDQKLFEALIPKLADIEIIEFTGSEKGDRVHIHFNSPMKMEWISKITENEVNEKEAFFTDEGVKLPFPLTYWKHKHLIQKISENRSYIIDDISFKASNPLLTWLMYPILYFAFYPRKKIYAQYFGA